MIFGFDISTWKELGSVSIRPEIWYEQIMQPAADENGGAKLGHGSGGIVLLRAV
jgi:hypothetical protein